MERNFRKTKNFTSLFVQHFRKLIKCKVVQSVRGPGGGYILARPAEEITVKDIFDSVGESTSFSDQISATEESSKEHKVLSDLLGKELDSVVINFLTTTTLKDLEDRLKNT
ncbi:MAG: Rrf2 family transcriptional regulator [Flavobacteriaceae bacterium]|nr:Rrf2 family transcriptional regulator [Flavobacteriaceae bacterium]